ncbi:hypothetical protein LCGC14_1215770 [marine sediment metagenome]|uniref:Uncharacterized protein n=1 Tax=marine sediment metagenome TaxID=412755 RepID=A0A0F9M040_9ZZZZ
MSLAEGLELKELRQALYGLCVGAINYENRTTCLCCTQTVIEGHKEDCSAWNALSRDKSSYEREAELMENLYLAMKKSEADLRELHDPLIEMGMDNHSMMDLEQEAREPVYVAYKAIDEFRVKTHPATAK